MQCTCCSHCSMSTILLLFYSVNTFSFHNTQQRRHWIMGTLPKRWRSTQFTVNHIRILCVSDFKTFFQNFHIFYYYHHDLGILWFGICDAGTLTDKQYTVIIRCIYVPMSRTCKRYITVLTICIRL